MTRNARRKWFISMGQQQDSTSKIRQSGTEEEKGGQCGRGKKLQRAFYMEMEYHVSTHLQLHAGFLSGTENAVLLFETGI